MSLRIDPLMVGAIRGSVMTFENVGDKLPMHRHRQDDVHITVFCRGSFRCGGPVIGETTYHAGAVVDWDVDVDHEFVALEDNSRLVNIIKNATS